jgi:hypothetical protein
MCVYRLTGCVMSVKDFMQGRKLFKNCSIDRLKPEGLEMVVSAEGNYLKILNTVNTSQGDTRATVPQALHRTQTTVLQSRNAAAPAQCHNVLELGRDLARSVTRNSVCAVLR